MTDWRFYNERQRRRSPVLLDDLGQYLYLYRRSRWDALTDEAGFNGDAAREINALFGSNSSSRHVAVTNVLSLFNRLSEECLTPDQIVDMADHPTLVALARMYAAYLDALRPSGKSAITDFALLQQEALEVRSKRNKSQAACPIWGRETIV
ncbi:MAG: hypothetical protein RMJ48_09915 [Roseiflexaceae bacterium]|nr:hypothetical protein [Roseiflexaceae bacterium]